MPSRRTRPRRRAGTGHRAALADAVERGGGAPPDQSRRRFAANEATACRPSTTPVSRWSTGIELRNTAAAARTIAPMPTQGPHAGPFVCWFTVPPSPRITGIRDGRPSSRGAADDPHLGRLQLVVGPEHQRGVGADRQGLDLPSSSSGSIGRTSETTTRSTRPPPPSGTGRSRTAPGLHRPRRRKRRGQSGPTATSSAIPRFSPRETRPQPVGTGTGCSPRSRGPSLSDQLHAERIASRRRPPLPDQEVEPGTAAEDREPHLVVDPGQLPGLLQREGRGPVDVESEARRWSFPSFPPIARYRPAESETEAMASMSSICAGCGIRRRGSASRRSTRWSRRRPLATSRTSSQSPTPFRCTPRRPPRKRRQDEDGVYGCSRSEVRSGRIATRSR